MSSIPPTTLADAIMIASPFVTAHVTHGKELLKSFESEALIKITIASITPQGVIKISTPKGDLTAQSSLETQNFLKPGQSYNLQVLNSNENNINIVLRPLNFPEKLPKDVLPNNSGQLSSNHTKLKVGLITTAIMFPQSSLINKKLQYQNSISAKQTKSALLTHGNQRKISDGQGSHYNIIGSTSAKPLSGPTSSSFTENEVTDKNPRNSGHSTPNQRSIFQNNSTTLNPFFEKLNQPGLKSKESGSSNQFRNERQSLQSNISNATSPQNKPKKDNRSQIISSIYKRYDSNINFNYNVSNSVTEDKATEPQKKEEPNIKEKPYSANQTIAKLPYANDQISNKTADNHSETILNSPESKRGANKRILSQNHAYLFDPIKDIPPTNEEANSQKAVFEVPSDKISRERPQQDSRSPQKLDIRILSIQTHDDPPKNRVQTATNTVIRTTLEGRGSSGQIILSSSLGLITLPHESDFPIGTIIEIELAHPINTYPELSKPPPPAPLAQLAFKWENLEQTVRNLEISNPAASAQIFQNNITTIGPQMIASLFQFIVAIRHGDLRSWLGKDISRSVEQLRNSYGKSLQNEFQTMKQASEPSESGWRAFFVPVALQENLHQMRFFIYKNKDGDSPSGKNSKNTRFILEINLSRIGKLQIDGRVKSNSIQILIRTKQPFPETVQNQLYEIFENTIKRTGNSGYLTFRVQKTFPTLPIQELTGYQEGVTSDLHI